MATPAHRKAAAANAGMKRKAMSKSAVEAGTNDKADNAKAKAVPKAKVKAKAKATAKPPAPWYKRGRLKPLYKAAKKGSRELTDWAERLYYRFNVARSERRLGAVLGARDSRYQQYLREQLEETLTKKRLFGTRRFEVIPLIDMLASKHDFAGQDVLCVGARNTDEIRYFRKRGVASVVGIDLYSVPPDILVMDMHDLKFDDASFDVVYSRHSFEHAYDKRKAASEFMRVLRPGGVVVIEVPGKYQGGGDYNYFNEIEDVTGAFGERIEQFLWREYSRKEENTDKMDIIRVMFTIRK